MSYPRVWFFRLSERWLFGMDWWGFSSRYMIVTWHRFGYGWLLTVGPLRIYRALAFLPESQEVNP